MTDQEHNSGRLNFQKWKSPDLRPLPKPSLSLGEDFLDRAMEIYPEGNDVSSPVEDSVSQSGEDLQSQIRKQLHNGGA